MTTVYVKPKRSHDPHMCHKCASFVPGELDWGMCGYMYVDRTRSMKPKYAYSYGCLLWGVEGVVCDE